MLLCKRRICPNFPLFNKRKDNRIRSTVGEFLKDIFVFRSQTSAIVSTEGKIRAVDNIPKGFDCFQQFLGRNVKKARQNNCFFSPNLCLVTWHAIACTHAVSDLHFSMRIALARCSNTNCSDCLFRRILSNYLDHCKDQWPVSAVKKLGWTTLSLCCISTIIMVNAPTIKANGKMRCDSARGLWHFRFSRRPISS